MIPWCNGMVACHAEIKRFNQQGDADCRGCGFFEKSTAERDDCEADMIPIGILAATVIVALAIQAYTWIWLKYIISAI